MYIRQQRGKAEPGHKKENTGRSNIGIDREKREIIGDCGPK